MRDKPLVDWAWVVDHLDDIAARSLQHLQIALLAVAAGFVISLVLGIAVARRPRASAAIIGVSGVLYTIPSIAAFAALVPITQLSLLTALIPLTAYTLLILIRNIVAGLRGVPADVLETADAMGYSQSGRLLRIELPLAIPLIIAGLRVASVSTIGLVTIASIIGDNFGGLGVFINDGLRNFFPTAVYVGAIMSVLLAIAVDLMFVVVQRLLTPWARAGGSARTDFARPGRCRRRVGGRASRHVGGRVVSLAVRQAGQRRWLPDGGLVRRRCLAPRSQPLERPRQRPDPRVGARHALGRRAAWSRSSWLFRWASRSAIRDAATSSRSTSPIWRAPSRPTRSWSWPCP